MSIYSELYLLSVLFGFHKKLSCSSRSVTSLTQTVQMSEICLDGLWGGFEQFKEPHGNFLLR